MAGNAVPDTSVKLALDRTFLAYERTLMAWIRTAASLISFGFGTYKFFQYLVESDVVRPRHSGLSARHFAVGMISVGIVSLIFAVVHQRTDLKLLGREYGMHWNSLASKIATLVVIASVALLVVVVLRG
jgi:putative membrane protein